ncbi:MAG: hypothetical protein H7251_00190 [Acetobacteraceae bacterium]|nr:hypothetical protein [Acetobacteraceae bacterium]
MDARSEAVRKLLVGDIFHGESPHRASLIYPVLSVTDTEIYTRTVTTQSHIRFDRATGVAKAGANNIPGVIDSVCALPIDVDQTMLGIIDQKFRLEADLEKLILTEDEIKALLFVERHYADNPLPSAE